MDAEPIDKEPNIYELPPQKVYFLLNTDDKGLSNLEAKKRLEKYGPDQIEEIKSKPLIIKFLENFYNILALLLWAASILSFISNSPQENLPSKAKVIREGKEIEILSAKLVPGNIIKLE